MENTLDILLRELYKHIDRPVYITMQYKNSRARFMMVPTHIDYSSMGLRITENDNWLLIDDDYYKLSMDDSNNCLQFSFRNEKDEVYYSICF